MSSEAAGNNEDAVSVPSSSSNANPTTEAKKLDTQAEKAFSVIPSESGFKVESTEGHLKLLQSLRKELNYINETDWMYDSLEKKPQQ